MTATILRLAWLAAGALALTAPASAQPAGELGCAVRLVTDEARANIRSLYARNGLNLVAQELIPPPLVARITPCLGGERGDDRVGRLVAALMSYELMAAAEASLVSRHSIAAPALEDAWARLAADQRRTLLPPEPGQQGGDAASVIVRFASILRPGTTRESLAQQGNQPLLTDLIAYAISRAVVEHHGPGGAR